MSIIPPTNIAENAICLQGSGIVCGLEVHINDDCSIEVAAGTAITGHGALIHTETMLFRSYLKTPAEAVVVYFHPWLAPDSSPERRYWQLEQGYDPKTMDSLKAQNPGDLPTRAFLEDKVLVLLLDENAPGQHYFVLASWSDMVLVRGLKDQVKAVSAASNISKSTGGLFKTRKTRPVYAAAAIEKVLYPYLQLPEIQVPRFGYKTLAIKDPAQRFGTANFQNPFLKITRFQDIFNEYKAILDDLIPDFYEALVTLHLLYGDLLTHKGAQYWKKYRDILTAKWEVFQEEGEHLYYIQYFYDWLTDLVKAYLELKAALTHFRSECACDAAPFEWTLVALGPVLGGRTSYKPLIFRDYYIEPLHVSHNAERLREIRLMHWRLMMMIWTFDLPFLKLDEKVLLDKFGLIPAAEFKDNTDIFESTDANADKAINMEDLPLKLTPGKSFGEPLGDLAIPYYYPLDSDSPYSVHQYWNTTRTLQHTGNLIRSYNAVENADSYSKIAATLYPLAFNIREFPFLRAEGHIGKKIKDVLEVEGQLMLNINLAEWHNLIQQHNLTMKVIALPVSGLANLFPAYVPGDNPAEVTGMDHLAGLEQAQTLVLIYADQPEQIELNECKKDKAPEIERYTIIADFTSSSGLG